MLITIDRRHPRIAPGALAALHQPVPHHPGLRKGERGEHTHDVEVDQRVQVGVERDRSSAHDSSPRTITPFEKTNRSPRLTNCDRHEPVAREDRGRAREVLVGGVRRQDQRSPTVKNCTHVERDRGVAEDRVRDLRERPTARSRRR